MTGIRGFKGLAAGLALAVAVTGVSPARAMMAPVDASVTTVAADRTQDLATIRTALQTKVIRQRLADMGLEQSEIDRRLNRLSDEQVHQVALRLEQQAPAGDDDDVWIGLAVGVLLVALIVWIMDKLD